MHSQACNFTFTEEGSESYTVTIAQEVIVCLLAYFGVLAPNFAPKNVAVGHLNVTHMNITWVKLIH